MEDRLIIGRNLSLGWEVGLGMTTDVVGGRSLW